jgi:hypothetical protein
MKTNRRKQRKNIKAARESLMEVLREIEKAAGGDENPARVKDLTDDKKHKQIQAWDSPTRGRN